MKLFCFLISVSAVQEDPQASPCSLLACCEMAVSVPNVKGYFFGCGSFCVSFVLPGRSVNPLCIISLKNT